jgi:predicted metal-dependent hydrolase
LSRSEVQYGLTKVGYRIGDRGTLRVNWRIVQAAPQLIDDVLAHEVVHVVQDDHGAEFWQQLGRIMPDYEERRRELRRTGARPES